MYSFSSPRRILHISLYVVIITLSQTPFVLASEEEQAEVYETEVYIVEPGESQEYQEPQTLPRPVQPAKPAVNIDPETNEALYASAVEMRKAGNAMLATGIIFMGGSLALIVTGLAIDDAEYTEVCDGGNCTSVQTEAGSNDEAVVGLLIGGLACFGLGVGLIVPGSIRRIRGGNRMKLYGGAGKTSRSNLSMSPFFSAARQSAGLNVSLGF